MKRYLSFLLFFIFHILFLFILHPILLFYIVYIFKKNIEICNDYNICRKKYYNSYNNVDINTFDSKKQNFTDNLLRKNNIDYILAGSGFYSGQVFNLYTNNVVYDLNSNNLIIPASNMKIFTAITVLNNLKSEDRFSTKVILKNNELILIAGGDVFLKYQKNKYLLRNLKIDQSTLRDLAKKTVMHLKQKNNFDILNISIDDNIFTGSTIHESWSQEDINNNVISPIFPIFIDRKMDNNLFNNSYTNQSIKALFLFRKALQEEGYNIENIKLTHNRERVSYTSSNILAEVYSPTVMEQVQFMLKESDNYLAEVLSRMSAVSLGKDGSFAEASNVMKTTLNKLGIETDSFILDDHNGLSMKNRVSVKHIIKAIKLIFKDKENRIHDCIDGFPIAGFDGTLSNRFQSQDSSLGLGIVRAKTGNLDSVSALSGYLLNYNGQLLIFSFVCNYVDNTRYCKDNLDIVASMLIES